MRTKVESALVNYLLHFLYTVTANKHGGANEKHAAKHKETKGVVAKLMSRHKRSGSRPFAWHTCVWTGGGAYKGCVFGTNGDVRAAAFCLPCSRSLSLSLSPPCVTSKSEARWLDLHLIQLVSRISATPKNSRLSSRLRRHLIPGNIIPGAVDARTHTHTKTRAHTSTWYLGLMV